jgi:hypothetical protein
MAGSTQRRIFLLATALAPCLIAAPPPATRPALATTSATSAATKPATTRQTIVSAAISGNPLMVGDSAIFIFRRSGGVERDLTVSFLPQGDTRPGVDFEPMPPHITIPAGFSFASLYVPTLSNRDRNDNRTIGLRVMPPPEHDLDAWLKAAPTSLPAATQPATGN